MECVICNKCFPKKDCKRCVGCRKLACGTCRNAHKTRSCDINTHEQSLNKSSGMLAVILNFIKEEKITNSVDEIMKLISMCELVEGNLLGVTTLAFITTRPYNFKYLWFDSEVLDITELKNVYPKSLDGLPNILLPRTFLKNFLTFREDLGQAGFVIYATNTDNQCVGFVTFQYTWSDDDLVINLLYVLPNYQRKGIGSALAHCVRQFYEKMHRKKTIQYPTSMQVMAEPKSIEFWKKKRFYISTKMPQMMDCTHMYSEYEHKPEY